MVRKKENTVSSFSFFVTGVVLSDLKVTYGYQMKVGLLRVTKEERSGGVEKVERPVGANETCLLIPGSHWLDV